MKRPFRDISQEFFWISSSILMKIRERSADTLRVRSYINYTFTARDQFYRKSVLTMNSDGIQFLVYLLSQQNFRWRWVNATPFAYSTADARPVFTAGWTGERFEQRTLRKENQHINHFARLACLQYSYVWNTSIVNIRQSMARSRKS